MIVHSMTEHVERISSIIKYYENQEQSLRERVTKRIVPLEESPEGQLAAMQFIQQEIHLIEGTSVCYTDRDAITFLCAKIMQRYCQLEHDALPVPFYVSKRKVYDEFLRRFLREFPSRKNPDDVLRSIMIRMWNERPAAFESFCLGVAAEYISTDDPYYTKAKHSMTLEDIRNFCIDRIHRVDASDKVDYTRKQEATHAFLFILGVFH